MKKIFKLLCGCLVCVLVVVTVFGCSCSKPLSINYDLTVRSEDGTKNLLKTQFTTIITQKFREPSDTPCYKKITK